MGPNQLSSGVANASEKAKELAAALSDLDEGPLSHYVMELHETALRFASNRRLVEDQWFEDQLQYLGYQDFLQSGEKEAWSVKAVANITRSRVKRQKARLADVLLPTDIPNWGIRPSPRPALPPDAQEKVLEEARMMAQDIIAQQQQAQAPEQAPPGQEGMMPPAQGAQEVPPDINAIAEIIGWDSVYQLVYDEAHARTERQSLKMLDQLNAGGFAMAEHKAINDAVKFGSACIKGPMVGEDRATRYVPVQEGGEVSLRRESHSIDRPEFYHVPLPNCFPDTSALGTQDRECFFELHRWTRSELKRKAKEYGFRLDPTVRVLKEDPQTTAIYSEFIRGIAAFELGDPNAIDSDRYFVWEYRGPIDANRLAEALEAMGDEGMEMVEAFGVEVKEDEIDPLAEVSIVCYFTEGECLLIRPGLLESGELPYSMWSLDPDETSPWGPGIPALGRSAQAIVTSSWRLANEAGALSGAPMWIVDESVVPNNNVFEIRPRKVWRRTDTASSDAPGLTPVEIAADPAAALEIYHRARDLFDEETMVGQLMDTETGQRESPPGMTLRASGINTDFRDLVRGFDMNMTIPLIRRLVEWNNMFGPEEAQGDADVVAYGSSVLLVREVQAGQRMTLLNLAGQNPEVGDCLRVPSIVRSTVHAMQLSVDEHVYPDEQIALNQERRMSAMVEAEQADTQGKIEVERTRQEGVQQVEQLRAQIEQERVESAERVAQYKAQVALETARLKVRADERKAAAEFALKKRGGTGV